LLDNCIKKLTFLWMSDHPYNTFMKHSINRGISYIFFGLMILIGLNQTSQAQEQTGALNFGFDAGANKYWGNFSDSHFGLGGDLFIRWNIIDWVSLRAAYNAGVIGYKTTQASINDEHALFGTPGPNLPGSDGGSIGSMNHIRYGGWQLMGEVNFFPDQTFVPYFLGGIEALNFEPDDVTPSPLEGNAAAAYSKNTIGGVLGVGFDMFITQKVTFNGQVLMHLTGTDWLDDYSSGNTASANAQANGATQVGNSNYRQDAYLTFGLGFSYNLFTPPQPEPPPPPPAASTTTIINNNTFPVQHDTVVKAVIYIDTLVMAKVDTVFLTGTTDTIYSNPPVNTIFNFPGTLFIVNTDQFNTSVPGNLSNLNQILHLVMQCPNLRVEIQGFASAEGTADHNQRLSELRAERIKTWLVAQGVPSDKVASTIGFGTSNPAVRERTDVSAAELERERVLNRRIAVKVVQACQ
jgi:outer membrane protein OmpA-like peptidoglycan-associated protein